MGSIDSPEGPPPPADALFSMDWVEKTAAPSGRGGAQLGPSPKDFYTLDAPGFIFSAPSVVIEEMFARSLFGLPSSMKVTSYSLSDTYTFSLEVISSHVTLHCVYRVLSSMEALLSSYLTRTVSFFWECSRRRLPQIMSTMWISQHSVVCSLCSCVSQ